MSFVILSKNLLKWETITIPLIDSESLTKVLRGVLRGQQGPLASQPWPCYIMIREMPCSWSRILTLLYLFSFWQFFSLIEQDVLHHTKEVFSVMCLRCANYKQDLLPCFIPCRKDKPRMAPECHLTRPAANMFATWERRAGEPGVWLLLIPQVYCFSFAILTRTSIALPWTKGLVVDSVMPCDAFIPWFEVEHHGCDIL